MGAVVAMTGGVEDGAGEGSALPEVGAAGEGSGAAAGAGGEGVSLMRRRRCGLRRLKCEEVKVKCKVGFRV